MVPKNGSMRLIYSLDYGGMFLVGGVVYMEEISQKDKSCSNMFLFKSNPLGFPHAIDIYISGVGRCQKVCGGGGGGRGQTDT